jgi:hypothetical protein
LAGIETSFIEAEISSSDQILLAAYSSPEPRVTSNKSAAAFVPPIFSQLNQMFETSCDRQNHSHIGTAQAIRLRIHRFDPLG